MLAWLSVWSKMQVICIWCSWCHCHPIISCSSKIQNGLPFWCRLTQVVLEKRLDAVVVTMYSVFYYHFLFLVTADICKNLPFCGHKNLIPRLFSQYVIEMIQNFLFNRRKSWLSNRMIMQLWLAAQKWPPKITQNDTKWPSDSVKSNNNPMEKL